MWFKRQSKSSKINEPANFERKCKEPLFAIVSEYEAKSKPYPYVYVNNDGSIRELHVNECRYLETPFHPADGGRPYIKETYDQKNGRGELRGFCHRSRIPLGFEIQEPPSEDPSKPKTIEDMIEDAKKMGCIVIHNTDGTITIQKPKQ